MKKLLITVLLLLIAIASYAGQKAISDTGKQVILNDDGTWAYVDRVQNPVQKIETNPMKFEKPQDATFLIKSIRNNSAYWINPTKWVFRKTEESAAIEYKFQLKGKDLYGMAITEGIEIPVETLTDVALSNAQNAAPDSKVIRQEYRIVNGQKVIYMEINGTIKGINFIYLGYYCSNSAGTTQWVAYTSANAVDKYKSEIMELLNGFTLQ